MLKYESNSLTVTNNIFQSTGFSHAIGVYDPYAVPVQVSGNTYSGLENFVYPASAVISASPPPPPPPPPAPPPAAPGIASLGVGSDQAALGDAILVSGTGVSGDSVQLYDGTSLMGTTAVTTAGQWAVTTPALAAGTHSLSATQTGSSGGASSASPTSSLTISLGTPNG